MLGPEGSRIERFLILHEEGRNVLFSETSSISGAAVGVARIQKEHPGEPISLLFNAIRVPVTPADTAIDIEERYHALHQKRSEEYNASPAGMEAARRLEHKRSQTAQGHEKARAIAAASTTYQFPDDLAVYRDDKAYNAAIAGLEWLKQHGKELYSHKNEAIDILGEEGVKKYLGELIPDESERFTGAVQRRMVSIAKHGWEQEVEKCRENLQNIER